MPQIIHLLGGRARTLVVMIVLVAIGVGVLGVTTSFVALAVLSLRAGIGTGVGMPLSIVTIASHVEPHERATALALRLTVNRGAQRITPVVMGVTIGAIGYGPSFLITGVFLLCVGVTVLRLEPNFERSELPLREEQRPRQSVSPPDPTVVTGGSGCLATELLRPLPEAVEPTGNS